MSEQCMDLCLDPLISDLRQQIERMDRSRREHRAKVLAYRSPVILSEKSLGPSDHPRPLRRLGGPEIR